MRESHVIDPDAETESWTVGMYLHFDLFGLVYTLGLTSLALFALVVDRRTLDTLGLWRTALVALIGPFLDLLILSQTLEQIGPGWPSYFMFYFFFLRLLPTVLPIAVKELRRRRGGGGTLGWQRRKPGTEEWH